jgi:hypothetical protein
LPLSGRCEIDGNHDPKGVKVLGKAMSELNIKGDAFQPEWNYTISSNRQSP